MNWEKLPLLCGRCKDTFVRHKMYLEGNYYYVCEYSYNKSLLKESVSSHELTDFSYIFSLINQERSPMITAAKIIQNQKNILSERAKCTFCFVLIKQNLAQNVLRKGNNLFCRLYNAQFQLFAYDLHQFFLTRCIAFQIFTQSLLMQFS